MACLHQISSAVTTVDTLHVENRSNQKYQYFYDFPNLELRISRKSEMKEIKKQCRELLSGIREAPGVFLFIIFVWGSVIGGIAYAGYERYQNYRVDQIMAGQIFGNRRSRIFHVPTCPEYHSVAENNLVIFSTVDEAEDAGFVGSKNCEDAVKIRKHNESGDYDPPESDHDGPM